MAIIVQGSRVAGVGKPGLSAYDLAKKGGYTGTEAEFSRELNAATSFDDHLESHNLDAEAHPDLQALIDEKIEAIPAPDVSGQIEAHNVAADAHSDIRTALDNKADSGHSHDASEITNGIIPVECGGTGVSSLDALVSALNIPSGVTVTIGYYLGGHTSSGVKSRTLTATSGEVFAAYIANGVNGILAVKAGESAFYRNYVKSDHSDVKPSFSGNSVTVKGTVAECSSATYYYTYILFSK